MLFLIHLLQSLSEPFCIFLFYTLKNADLYNSTESNFIIKVIQNSHLEICLYEKSYLSSKCFRRLHIPVFRYQLKN